MSHHEFKKITLTYIKILHKHHKITYPLTYQVTSQGNSYTLIGVCNPIGYLMTIPIKIKKTMTVANHLFPDIMLKLGFPRILHSDKGTEFKSRLIENLSQQHDIKKTYFSSPPAGQQKIRIFT